MPSFHAKKTRFIHQAEQRITTRLTEDDDKKCKYFEVTRFETRAKRRGHPLQIQRERMMLQKLKFFKTKLEWSQKWATDRVSRKEAEVLYRQRMWGTIGYLKYHFPVDNLKIVMKNLMKIGKYPSGYMYPELHLSASMPINLKNALLRKPKPEPACPAEPQIEEEKKRL